MQKIGVLLLILILILSGIAFGLWLHGKTLRASLAARDGQIKALFDGQEEFRRRIQAESLDSLEKQLSVFRTTELRAASELARKQYELEFEKWKSECSTTLREDAIKKSKAVNRGLIAEQLAPHMAGFAYNPKDAHFIGCPIDYIVFDGLDSGNLQRIVLLEVKTGESQMNARERQVRSAVQESRVSYEIFRLEE